MDMEDYIDSLKSDRGGWSKESLAKLGVPYPPPKGWKRALIEGRDIPTFNGWNRETMQKAEIVMRGDSYYLMFENRELQVPGWMVGDDEMAAQKLAAARIIRKRLTGVS